MVTDQVTLTVKKKLKTLEQTWHTYAGGILFREAVDYSLGCIKNYKLQYLLSDTTNAKPLNESDLEYCNHVLKEMQRQGLRQFITVKPVFPITNYTLLQIKRQVSDVLPVRVFETRQDAILTIQQELLNDTQLSLF